MKIILRVPGYSDVTFNSYENLNIIWEIMENYKDCSIIPIYDNEDKTTTTTTVDDTIKVEENVESVNEVTKEVLLSYQVPKSVTFTSRFQNRINKELTDVLDSVYPDCFIITNIKFDEIEDNIEDMLMTIHVQAKTDDAIDKLRFLDKNVEFIVKDLVDYYIQ